MGFAPEPGEYDGQPVPQEEAFPTRYVLRAMTLEDAHKQGFSTRWFDERAKTREELEESVDVYMGLAEVELLLDELVSWPTQDGP